MSRYDSARNPTYFKDHINAARAIANGRPIWITEFAPSGTDAEVKAFLADVIPWMDQSKDIHRYAMFMAREGMLVNRGGNGMSEVGRMYVEAGTRGGNVEARSENAEVANENRDVGEEVKTEKRFFTRAEAAIMKVKKLGKRKDMPCVKCRSSNIFEDCYWAKCRKGEAHW
jgi:hypothetical protein